MLWCPARTDTYHGFPEVQGGGRVDRDSESSGMKDDLIDPIKVMAGSWVACISELLWEWADLSVR